MQSMGAGTRLMLGAANAPGAALPRYAGEG